MASMVENHHHHYDDDDTISYDDGNTVDNNNTNDNAKCQKVKHYLTNALPLPSHSLQRTQALRITSLNSINHLPRHRNDHCHPHRLKWAPFNSLSGVITFATITLILSCHTSYGFLLDGSQNSFAQFRKWYTGLNGTLEFEFKTEQPNGLVLYTDDGGTFDFFEIKLVEGAVRLRYNLGGGANIITVGRDLHENHWHKVQVSY